MFGFSIEFKRWYFVLRGPKGRVYLATGFAKEIPNLQRYPISAYDWSTYWDGEETDEKLLEQLKEIR
jgi:hypothetical protein